MGLNNANDTATINLLTLPEMCNKLNIGRNTAYNLLNSGEIHGFKLGVNGIIKPAVFGSEKPAVF